MIQKSFSSTLSRGGHHKKLWHRRRHSLSEVVHPAFPLKINVTHPPRCCKGWFWKRLLWCITCPNHASFHLFIVARKGSAGPTKKFTPSHWSFPPSRRCGEVSSCKSVSNTWTLFFRVSKQGPCLTAMEEDGEDKRSVQPELVCEAYHVDSPDPV